MLQAHLACAAFELALHPPEDVSFFGPGLAQALSALQAARLLGPHPQFPTAGALCFTGLCDSPAAAVSLRTIDPERWAQSVSGVRCCGELLIWVQWDCFMCVSASVSVSLLTIDPERWLGLVALWWQVRGKGGQECLVQWSKLLHVQVSKCN